MRMTRLLVASAFAVGTLATFAPAAHAAPLLGSCDGRHDVEVHVTPDQCVLIDWPVTQS